MIVAGTICYAGVSAVSPGRMCRKGRDICGRGKGFYCAVMGSGGGWKRRRWRRVWETGEEPGGA